MLAVVQIGGHQHIVSGGDTFRVDSKLSAEETLTCDKVLLVTEPDGKGFQVGMPYIDGMTVEFKVIGRGKDRKVRVFKMESKKRYQKTYGHRQDYVDLQVVKIGNRAVKLKSEGREQKVENIEERVEGMEREKMERPRTVRVSAAKKVSVKKTAVVKKSGAAKKTVSKKAV